MREQGITFLCRVLDTPSYGFTTKDGALVKPSARMLFKEFGSRMNIFRSIRNWLTCWGWSLSLSLAIPFTLFFTHFFSWSGFVTGFIYSMVLMGSHGTFWLHRYCTHRAFKFTHPFYRFITRNLVIKIIPEEIYVISHHVHHQFSEKPGDPYNVHGGWLYCFFSDAIHQMINPNLNEADYNQLCKLMAHTGVKLNTYAQYKKYGTLCHPVRTMFHYILNWAFWFGVFYAIGGLPFAVTVFGWAGVWAIGVRTYNFDGHGGGKDKRRAGVDFNYDDLSINQLWPGYVAGEWHNNHHLFPSGSRSGFLKYQLDLPWLFISFLKRIGAVTGVRDYKDAFINDYYLPFINKEHEKSPAEDKIARVSVS